MKNIDKMIEKFNTPDTRLVVSAWPQKKGEREMNHGVAWYTKLTLTHIAKTKGTRFVVLAEEGFDNTPELVGNGKILVLRIFSPTRHSLYPAILKWLRKFTNISHIFVHSEFGAGTGLVHYALLLPFLTLIRATGKHITYFAHNVITDITFLQTHLGIDTSPFIIDTTNVLIHIHTHILSALVDRIVVLDEALKARLEKILPYKNINTSIIPVKLAKSISKTKAKKILSIPSRNKVILSFGFLSSYKGSDWLASAFAGEKNITVILAGGPAHSLKNRTHYESYYQKLKNSAGNVTITGFVPEKDIATYFTAADLVVLPYRGLMGASGALTHALVYGKPFMCANPMQELWKNTDIQEIVQSYGKKDDLFFPLSWDGARQLLKTVHSGKKLAKLTHISKALAQTRTIQHYEDTAYNLTYEAPFRLAGI